VEKPPRRVGRSVGCPFRRFGTASLVDTPGCLLKSVLRSVIDENPSLRWFQGWKKATGLHWAIVWEFLRPGGSLWWPSGSLSLLDIVSQALVEPISSCQMSQTWLNLDMIIVTSLWASI
jgi:hypothetical protein